MHTIIVIKNIGKKEGEFMSSFYEAYYGSALVLDQDEFDELIDTYQNKIIRRLKQSLIDDFDGLVLDEDGLLSEYPFIKSKFQDEDPNTILEEESNSQIFDIIEISSDNCDGMFLIPYYNNGKLNWEPNSGKSFHGKTVYVIFSDNQLDSPLTFLAKPYESYDDFINEFKDKLANYLPSDFDWDAHVGSFSYSSWN